MKIYAGGSNKDLEIYDGVNSITYDSDGVITDKLESDTVTSKGNQIFITFKTDINGVGKKFTPNITFGIRTNY